MLYAEHISITVSNFKLTWVLLPELKWRLGKIFPFGVITLDYNYKMKYVVLFTVEMEQEIVIVDLLL